MLFKLKVIDRVLLNGLLPVENDIVTLKVIKKLREDIGFSEEELKQTGLRKSEDGKSVNWDNDSVEKEIEIGEKGQEIIFEELKSMNKQKKLTEDHFHLYDLFVGDRA